MLVVRQPRSFDSFDRMFDQLTAGFARTTRPATPPVRADWEDGTLFLTVDLPGVPREAVKVEVADRALTIAVDHKDNRGEYRWSRSVQLGGSLDTDAVNARYADGRLTVTVPPAQKPEPRVVSIEVGESAPAAIEATADTSQDESKPTES